MADSQFTTPVEYRAIPGFPGYAVGSDGSVWTSRKGENKRMKCFRDKDGYARVQLTQYGRKVKKLVAHLVLEAFVGSRPDGMESRHFPDRDPANNSINNLSWSTHKVNVNDKRVHGTFQEGERHGMHKLTTLAASSIRRLCNDWNDACDLAKAYSVSPCTIWRVKKGKTWASA